MPSVTPDRCKEFVCYVEIENKLELDIYFTDSHSPWQKGCNENSNGLLIRYYPKGTDLGTVTEEELSEVLYKISFRPRKCLGWSSPKDEFLHEVMHLGWQSSSLSFTFY